MKKLVIYLILCISFFGYSNVIANPLLTDNEYTVGITTQNLGTNSWKFTYEIYNVNQSASQYAYTGLDGFSIEIPSTAVISNVTVPAPYFGFGSWGYGVDSGTLFWTWGYEVGSVYPIGSTATFSFKADNVDVGAQESKLTTYWHYYPPANYETWATPYQTYYTTFDATLTGPVAAVPEPTTMLLLGLGLVGLAGLRRKMK